MAPIMAIPVLLLFGLIFLGGIIGLVILLTSPAMRGVAGVLLSIAGLLVVLVVLAGMFYTVRVDHVKSLGREEIHRAGNPMLLRPADPEVRETAARVGPTTDSEAAPQPPAAAADSSAQPDAPTPSEPPAWLEGTRTWTAENAYWARVRVGPYPRDEGAAATEPLPRKLGTDELRQALARDSLLREMFQDAVDQAVAHYIAYLEPGQPVRVEVPTSFVLERLLAESWQSAAPGPDAIPLEPAAGDDTLVDLHLLLRFDATARHAITALRRDAVVQTRLGTIGRGLIGLFALLGVLLGYLRIDLATRGAYRGRLRCAAVFAILVVVVASVLSVAG